MVTCEECGANIPYGSLCATVLLCTGIGFFAGSSIVGISETQTMFDQTSIGDDMNTFLEALKYSIYGMCAVFGLYSLLLLFLGFVATAQAKKQVYATKEITFRGKCCMNSAAVFTYIMMLIWLFVTCAFVIPTIFMKMTHDYCNSDNVTIDDGCLDLTWYGLGDNTSLGICGDALDTYCTQADKALILFLVSFIAAAVSTLGMVNFLMCLAANSGLLNDGMKRQDYEMKRNREEQELFHLTMNKSTDRLATASYF